MECKSLPGLTKIGGDLELIDTLWNVNNCTRFQFQKKLQELIDTLWNVNTVK